MSNLIIKCPACEAQGITRTVADFLPDGQVKIYRSRQLYADPMGDFTLVAGNDFSLLCGKCKETIFWKRPILLQQTTTIFLGTV